MAAAERLPDPVEQIPSPVAARIAKQSRKLETPGLRLEFVTLGRHASIEKAIALR
jgi:hypothetical protein